MPRLDIPAKIFGTFDFVQDVKVPGMVHARMVHPAGVGANAQSFDDAACRKIPGYVRAVRKGDFLAVVATNEWAAISASNAIVAKWSEWDGFARRVAALRVRAQLEGRPQTKCFKATRRHGRGDEARRQDVAGDLRPCDEHARIDRAVVRSR